MRIVFMGSPADVISPLETLLKAQSQGGIELIAVVSQPARPKGRGKALLDPPVADFAKARGILTLQPEKASAADFLSSLAGLKPDVIITAAYGQILSEAFLKIPTRATINIHPSLLPEYRGAIPVAAALLDGRTETGVSILFTVRKLDAGNIIRQESRPVPAGITAGDLTNQLFQYSGRLLLEALDLLKDPAFVGVPQDESRVTHCRKIAKEDGRVQWTDPAQLIVHKYQAYSPWPGVFTFFEDQRVNLIGISQLGNTEEGLTGQFTFVKSENAIVATTGKGTIKIRQLQRAGSKLVDAAAFWNGLKNKDDASFTS